MGVKHFILNGGESLTDRVKTKNTNIADRLWVIRFIV